MHLRLAPEFGGDGTFCGIIALHDTGSNILSLFISDFLHLGNTQGYQGWLGYSHIREASGTATYLRTILIQVQLVGNDGMPWSDWFWETGVVRTPNPDCERLTGSGIRDMFYIGTGPGNHVLAVSATKSGLTTLL